MNDSYAAKTKSAFFWTHLLNTPFWAIYHMLPFILYKDLNATALQIYLLIALRPVVSIFSLYWSSVVHRRRDRLKWNVIWAGILGHLPFFFVLWIDNPWYFVGSAALYMLTVRGVIPAWMEILKLNIPGCSRHKIFAYASSLSYIGSALFPFFFGWLMDDISHAWRWIFIATALLSLSASLLQLRIPIEASPDEGGEKISSIREWLGRPWRSAWEIMSSRIDFSRFQVGFMLGGFGLMVIQPVLPAFFTDTLFLSYKELGMALTLCKGVGYAATSPIWARWMNQWNIYRFISIVTLMAAAFPLFLLAACEHGLWLYIAYLSYGIMQGGSEMGWKMSGPLFAKNADSSPFSSVNVLMVGVRGAIAPALGEIVGISFGVFPVMILGFVFCMIATVYMTMCSRRLTAQSFAGVE